MTVAQLLIFIPAVFILALGPGPSNLTTFTNATRSGWLAAVRAVFGRIAAMGLMTIGLAFGLDVLLRTSEYAFMAVKWAGAAYLVYLGVRMWRAPVGALPPPSKALAKREFLTAMGNPKYYLLFSAFLPQFVLPGSAVAPQLLILGAAYLCVEVVAASCWAGVGAVIGSRALTVGRRLWLNRASGAVMIGAAGLLARTEQSA
ncbi:LysE family translocator [Actibacterium lipolyticum]|uniref:Homoserine/homoserine lactone efflux protein n=1 Tax=Actibacterium lipolyticum TaxID=1524263 RepID=A0A238KHX0_9RHOB|nr:LysE family translocator [Actibacterium lipolyticum]SMX42204.1 Homoserine/homoserine lactone efflux protein [Actibacterium lipolyticum]